MKHFTLECSQVVPRPIEETFAFFSDTKNLGTITPDWLHFEILTPAPITMCAGAQIAYQLRLGWFPLRWLTEIRVWTPPHRFVDVQLRGPYKLWEHEHTFEAVPEGTLMRDVVRYALPLGPIGWLAHFAFVKADLNRIFQYRQKKIASLLGAAPIHA